jgi:hypothetical protein
MKTAELRNALSQLLALEEGRDVDWDLVQDISIRLLAELRAIEDQKDYPAEVVLPYLTEFNLRRQSSEEQQRQHGLLISYLRSH